MRFAIPAAILIAWVAWLLTHPNFPTVHGLDARVRDLEARVRALETCE